MTGFHVFLGKEEAVIKLMKSIDLLPRKTYKNIHGLILHRGAHRKSSANHRLKTIILWEICLSNGIKIVIFYSFIYFMYVGILPACISVYNVCGCHSLRSEGHQTTPRPTSRTGVIDDFEAPCGCWESIPLSPILQLILRTLGYERGR